MLSVLLLIFHSFSYNAVCFTTLVNIFTLFIYDFLVSEFYDTFLFSFISYLVAEYTDGEDDEDELDDPDSYD